MDWLCLEVSNLIKKKIVQSLAIQGVAELQKCSAYGNNKGAQRDLCKKNYSHSFTKACFTAEK